MSTPVQAPSDDAPIPRPRLAVVICTLGRPGYAAQVVADVRLQLGPHDEVVVIDQSAAPEREALAAALERRPDPRVRHLVRSAEGLPKARWEGLQATRARWVWYVDDDVRLWPGALEALCEALKAPGVGGASGRIVERVVRPNARRTTNRLGPGGRVRTRLDGREVTELQTLKGAHMAYVADLLRRVGPPDRGLGGTAFLEDADWSTRVRRAGGRLVYTPWSTVEHLSAPTAGCRPADPVQAEAWRFHNTARFLRRHRPRSVPRASLTFTGIALKRALEWRSPGAWLPLARAFWRGWRHAHRPDPPSPDPIG